MAPPNPKRPPRPPRPPGQQAPSDDSAEELPFDDDEVAPLQADDPRPQRVPQYPAGPRKLKRRGPGERTRSDRELSPRYDWAKEYTDPGMTPAFVYVERGPGAGQLVPLRQGSITLGRSSTSDLRLQHASISRRHAQLTRRGNGFMVRDLGSQNGTFVNRIRIKGEVEIRPGDELSLGNATLRVRGAGGGPTVSTTSLEPILPRRTKRPLGGVAVALAAAVVGSAVAALISIMAMRMTAASPADPTPTKDTRADPPTEVRATEDGAPREASEPAEGARGPDAKAPGPGAPEDGRTVQGSAAPGASDGIQRLHEGPVAANSAPSATDIARGMQRSSATSKAGSTSPSATHPTRGPHTGEGSAAASDIVRGEHTRSASMVAEESPSASDIARGEHTRSASTVAEESPSASDIARGMGSAKPGTGGSDAARGSGHASSGSMHRGPVAAAASGTPDERLRADILSRYESGDVSGALAQARRANLAPLVQQLTRFQTAEATARTALAKQDRPRALDALGVAVRLDQELSQGWSRQGAGLRRQLAGLYVNTGQEAARARRFNDAREAFNAALQYDSTNTEARAQLTLLDAQAPATP
ncbi:FHA domain-containing protein [Corallococcus silvisoli]|uniref:FHA domain-containing protein n=1 Tax=Corallococcus silvisoli TaxID=2697031 RepID=UPI00191C6BFB|nr:FHA domain-containing protein [Corallococcus silvisoli]